MCASVNEKMDMELEVTLPEHSQYICTYRVCVSVCVWVCTCECVCG